MKDIITLFCILYSTILFVNFMTSLVNDNKLTKRKVIFSFIYPNYLINMIVEGWKKLPDK